MVCLLLRRFRILPLIITLVVSVGYRTFAQEAYRSEIDDLLTVSKVTVLPFTDNLQGIYARPLEAHLTELIGKMHRWDLIPANGVGPIVSSEELESSPEKVIQMSQALDVDGLFVARVTKGPNGVSIVLNLFLKRDGKLLAQAAIKDFKQFDTESLRTQLSKMLNEIASKIPYSGRVLSREGNRVTVDLGREDGIHVNQLLSVIQIIQAKRHPKFNFIVGSEKEVFGKIKILKVDETLSFGTVVMEKERGAVRRNSKIGPLDVVTYSGSESLSLTPSPEEALSEREDANIAFGKDARAWRPENAPTIGQVGARLGLSRFEQNTQVGSGVGGLEASNPYAPNLFLEGEIWITPEWTFHARLRQGLLSVDNPRSGGTPGTLNQSVSYYDAGIGYRFRFGPQATSAYAEPFLGYLNYKLYTDDSSPEAFTSQQYTGLRYGALGASPITPVYGLGGEFAMVWKPTVKESPVTSGSSSSSQIVQFGIFGYKKMSERLRLQCNLEFEMYSSNFGGTGSRAESASSSSHRYTTLSGGLYYLF